MEYYKIGIPQLLEMIQQGDKKAAEVMGDNYDCGYEEQGIYVDPVKAKEYYDMAGVDYEFEFEDDDDNDNMDDVIYIVEGPASALEAVKTLIEELIKSHGRLDKETVYPRVRIVDCYLPIGILINALVGSPYYHGHLYRMDVSDDDILLFAKVGTEALQYALPQRFNDLKVKLMGP